MFFPPITIFAGGGGCDGMFAPIAGFILITGRIPTPPTAPPAMPVGLNACICARHCCSICSWAACIISGVIPANGDPEKLTGDTGRGGRVPPALWMGCSFDGLPRREDGLSGDGFGSPLPLLSILRPTQCDGGSGQGYAANENVPPFCSYCEPSVNAPA